MHKYTLAECEFFSLTLGRLMESNDLTPVTLVEWSEGSFTKDIFIWLIEQSTALSKYGVNYAYSSILDKLACFGGIDLELDFRHSLNTEFHKRLGYRLFESQVYHNYDFIDTFKSVYTS